MTKQQFHERVSIIAENLEYVMNDYNDGCISIEEFKQKIKEEMSYYPYDCHIAVEGDCEYDENMVEGELYPTDEFWAMHEFISFVEDFINDAHNWDKSRFTTTGSNSFLFCLIGEEGINY